MIGNTITDIKTKYTAFIEKNNKLFLDLVADPFMIDTDHKYLEWLIYVFQKEKVDLSLKDIINALKKFDDYNSKLDRKNIYSYTDIYDVQNAVNNYIRKEDKIEATEIEQSYLEKQHKKNQNEELEYYTYTEFSEMLNENIVDQYPKTINVNDYNMTCGYDINESGDIVLYFSIPHYNTIIHVDVHLFDYDSPLTLYSKDMTSERDNMKLTIRLPFRSTVFKDRAISFSLLKKQNKGAEICLKMIEYSVALYMESPQFKQQYSVEYVYGKHPIEKTDAIMSILNYIKEKEERTSPATKYDYIHNYLNRKVNVRKFQSKTFKLLKDNEIIDTEMLDSGYTFKLGRNYNAFIEGRLR